MAFFQAMERAGEQVWAYRSSDNYSHPVEVTYRMRCIASLCPFIIATNARKMLHRFLFHLLYTVIISQCPHHSIVKRNIRAVAAVICKYTNLSCRIRCVINCANELLINIYGYSAVAGDDGHQVCMVACFDCPIIIVQDWCDGFLIVRDGDTEETIA